MVTQVALNPRLRDPFSFYKLSKADSLKPGRDLIDDLRMDFERGKVVILEGFEPENRDFFLNLPFAEFPEWVPPVEDHEILTERIDERHPFWKFYPDENTIEEFQKKLKPFQDSWQDFHCRLFSEYDFSAIYWSWRFNKMDLGYLHLDIPPNYKEHQQRAFMNLSHRARVLEIGPSLESLISHFYESRDLDRFKALNNTDYLTEIKKDLFKQLRLDEHYLPRHTLRLGTGAIWISHSSLITHGIVFGEKTACLEARIPPDQIRLQESEFSKVMERVKRNEYLSPEPIELYE